jgi:predicted nuclease of predicted toxin-antitoxin system
VRILIDECVDWRLRRALQGHHCISVQEMGWSGVKNGKLLALAQAEFDIFLTADRNLSFQQNTTKYQIAVVVLAAGSTLLNKTLPLMPKVLMLMPDLTPGHVSTISSETD